MSHRRFKRLLRWFLKLKISLINFLLLFASVSIMMRVASLISQMTPLMSGLCARWGSFSPNQLARILPVAIHINRRRAGILPLGRRLKAHLLEPSRLLSTVTFLL